MREKDIERRLISAVKKERGLCLKFVSPGNDGMPDRIIILPGGKIGFVEVKTQGLRPRPLQFFRLNQLLSLGVQAHVLDNPDDIQRILQMIGGDEHRTVSPAPLPEVRD